ncbi:MAG: metallophosphoesterase [Candidatus Nanoarchaeia archaeon]
MKILAFADPHNSLTAFEKVSKLAKKAKVDYILCAGDITLFGHNIEAVMKKLNKLPAPVLLIHGNHEDEEVVEFLAKELKNIRFIHGKAIRIGKVLFLAYGGEGFRIRMPEFDQLAKLWKKEIRKRDKIILMLHQPPYGVADLVLDEHAGSKSFTKFIKDVQPALVFCGHLHENFGVEGHIGKSHVVNPGPYGRIFDV